MKPAKKDKIIKAWAIKVKRGGLVCPAPSTQKDSIGNNFAIYEDQFSAKAKLETYPQPESFKVVPCEIKLLNKYVLRRPKTKKN